jgi:hypothetical protein
MRVFGLGQCNKKNYTTIKAVLDEALTKYARLGGLLKTKRPLKEGMHTFIHTTPFPCVKQPEDSQKEAYYALYQMRLYVRDHHNLTLLNSLKSWAEHLAMIQDKDLRAEYYRIQEQFAMIIYQDVIRKGGLFYTATMKPSNAEIDKRLLLQGADMPFLLAGGSFRFVPDVGKPKC